MTSPTPNNTDKHAKVKFRPVLTLAQITTIVHQFQPLVDEESRSILKVLVPMIAKIEVGAINPAYKLSEHKIIKDTETAQRVRYESGMMSTEEEASYESQILGLGEI
jgi:hypothetical protein